MQGQGGFFMKISITATTHVANNPKDIASKAEFDNFGGKSAGICYMPSSFNDLLNEPAEKTARRTLQTKNSGHHSVYDHAKISLYLEDIPKALAIVLNNEKDFATSEKSARYTKMVLQDDEKVLYNKWLEIFEKLISDKYKQKCPDFFTNSRITKLAQENARYLTSVFTPTSMEYTLSYRQLNYLYSFLKRESEQENNSHKFYKALKPCLQEFCRAMEENLPYLDEMLQNDGKNRRLSLFRNPILKPEKHFSTIYSTYYKGSFAQLAQAQRHRTLSYNINLLDSDEYFVPPILKSNPTLVAEWEKDINSLSVHIPQGLLVNINESGTYENLLLKAKERCCTFAQKEIQEQTTATIKEYYEALKDTNPELAEHLLGYTKGSRCTFKDYKCQSPCGFADGISGEREI